MHLRGASYRFIGTTFGIDHATVIEHVQKALRKLERAMRGEPPKPRRPAKRSQTVGVEPFAR